MEMTVVEAGRKGGRTTHRRWGRDFYVHIGKMGQVAMRKKYPNMAGTWGKMGGRPRKLTLAEIMGENGQIVARGGHSGSASANARLPHQN